MILLFTLIQYGKMAKETRQIEKACQNTFSIKKNECVILNSFRWRIIS